MQKFFLEPVFDNKEVFFVFVKVISPFLLTNEATGFCVLNYIFKIKVSNNKKELLIEQMKIYHKLNLTVKKRLNFI